MKELLSLNERSHFDTANAHTIGVKKNSAERFLYSSSLSWFSLFFLLLFVDLSSLAVCVHNRVVTIFGIPLISLLLLDWKLIKAIKAGVPVELSWQCWLRRMSPSWHESGKRERKKERCLSEKDTDRKLSIFMLFSLTHQVFMLISYTFVMVQKANEK